MNYSDEYKRSIPDPSSFWLEAGRANDRALIYESPVSNTRRTYTFAELQESVSRTAGMLADLDAAKGDRVII